MSWVMDYGLNWATIIQQSVPVPSIRYVGQSIAFPVWLCVLYPVYAFYLCLVSVLGQNYSLL